MLRMLVVDDEPEIAESLYELFLEAAFPDTEIYRSSFSSDALSILNTVKIDLLLTDIRMPEINGFQLAEAAKENWPKCKVIYLTGYNEFEYAYNAIKSECADYLLKTESDGTILEVVEKTLAKIKEGLQDEVLMDKVRRQSRMAVPMLQKEFIKNQLNGLTKPSEVTQSQMDELQIPIDIDEEVFLLIGRIDQLLPGNISGAYNNEFITTVRLIAEEAFCRYPRKFSLEYENSSFLCLIQPEREKDERKENTAEDTAIIKGTIETVQNICCESLKITVSFILCGHKISWRQLGDEFFKLKKMLDFSWGIGREAFLTDESYFAGEFERISRHEDEIGENEVSNLRYLNALMDCLERGMQEEYFQLLAQMIGCLRKVKSMNHNLALEIYCNVSSRLLSYINRWKLADSIAFRIGLYKLTKVDSHDSWNDAADYLIVLSKEIFDAHKSDQDNVADTSVKFIQKHIHEHLGEELSLDKLAGLMHFNPSYLSRLFKQVAGVNLSEYIMDQRVEKAKYLLAETNLKINELTQAIGLGSPTYFARIFKKATNMSPLDYREFSLKK